MPPRIPALVGAVLVGAVILTGGCASHRAASLPGAPVATDGEPAAAANADTRPDPIQPGDHVRLTLRDGSRVEGTVASITADAITLELEDGAADEAPPTEDPRTAARRALTRDDRGSQPAAARLVTIPRDELAAVEVRQGQLVRAALVLVGFTAVLFAVAVAAIDWSN